MEIFSALLAFYAGNSPVTGEFPSQRPVTRSFDVFFDLRLNKRLSKQSRRRWFETPSRSLWRHNNVWSHHWGPWRIYPSVIMIIIVSGNGLSPIRRHAITWHNTDLHGQLNFEHVWWMFHSNTHIFIQEIAFEYVVCKTVTILFRSFVITRNVGQWSTTKPKTPTSGFVTAHGD